MDSLCFVSMYIATWLSSWLLSIFGASHLDLQMDIESCVNTTICIEYFISK
jgi:hypothetical protein